MHKKRINISIVLAGQRIGLKEVDDAIWLVSFITCDLGYIDLEQRTLRPLDNPFGTYVSGLDTSRNWSGRRESNPRHSAWEADVLPLNYARTSMTWCSRGFKRLQQGLHLTRQGHAGNKIRAKIRARHAGQFSSCGPDEADGLPFLFCEGFSGGPWFLACFPDQVEGGVADRGERLGCRSGADPAVVLAERDVADVEQAVLDLPVVAGELQQAGCSDEGGIEAGDGVDHLARAAILQLADALDAADRLEARPRLIEAGRQLGAHLNAPDLDAAVALLDRLGADEIGGITPLGL